MNKFRWLISIEFNDINIDHLPVDLRVEPFKLNEDPLFLKNGFKIKIEGLPEYKEDLEKLYQILSDCYNFVEGKNKPAKDESAVKLFLYDKDDMIVEQWEIEDVWPSAVAFEIESPNIEVEWMFNKAEMTYHFNVEDSMQTVEFFRGTIGNQNGDKWAGILKWSNGALEMGHDEIQWVFPSNEVSMMNVHAPVMTKEESEIFQNDEDLKTKTKETFIRYLDFLELNLVQDDDLVLIESKVTLPRWMRRFNHNMLRVTRIMKSLRLTGHTKYANALYVCLIVIAAKPENKDFAISQNTWNYWHDAIFAPLWNADGK